MLGPGGAAQRGAASRRHGRMAVAPVRAVVAEAPMAAADEEDRPKHSTLDKALPCWDALDKQIMKLFVPVGRCAISTATQPGLKALPGFQSLIAREG